MKSEPSRQFPCLSKMKKRRREKKYFVYQLKCYHARGKKRMKRTHTVELKEKKNEKFRFLYLWYQNILVSNVLKVHMFKYNLISEEHWCGVLTDTAQPER